jgi:hypothetical protein
VGVAGGGAAAVKVKGAGKDAAGVDKGKGPELALSGRVVPTEENLATAAKTEKHLPVHLFVAAVGDGEVRANTPAKTREILEQVVRKSSKEQNTVVHVQGDGPLHIQLRVFAATSVEARALKEYIRTNEDQTPCPFIMLVRQLPMAVQYDPTSLDPSISSVADRLRKQAKTRAIKLLREVIFDAESGVTAAMLRGREGPMVPARRLEALVMRRAVPLHSDGAVGLNAVTAFIVFPAVRRDVPAAAAADGHSGDEPGAEQIPALRPSAAANLAWTAGGATWGGVTRRIDQYFPVSLTVVAIGEGKIEPTTQPKLLRRLKQMITKVPKEHHCTVELPSDGPAALKMRLFVADSEDAKAAREYVQANAEQRPSPLVILTHALPIAVSYDGRQLDVTDANVVDCLRKQAKTRAVKLVKETVVDPAVGVTLPAIRGERGALELAQLLEAALMKHAETREGHGKPTIFFAARNRQSEDAAGSRFNALDTLAGAAATLDGGGKLRGGQEERWPGGGQQLLGQPRTCEMCKGVADGSYGTGRFCSKACRYDSHALRVAQKRRVDPGPGADGRPAGKAPTIKVRPAPSAPARACPAPPPARAR